MISRAERVLNHSVLILVSIFVLVPVVWFLFTALSPNRSGQLDLLHPRVRQLVPGGDPGIRVVHRPDPRLRRRLHDVARGAVDRHLEAFLVQGKGER